VTLKVLHYEDFKQIVEDAHLICFKELRPRQFNTFNYAILIENEQGTPMAYATIIELDKDTCYMQHGGAFPGSEKGPGAVRAYHMIMNYLRESYARSSTIIKNTNIAMIKLAYSAGFIIHGVDYMEDGIYLHLMNDFRGDDNGLVDSSSDGRGLNAPAGGATTPATAGR
jgi:hypothetical protein